MKTTWCQSCQYLELALPVGYPDQDTSDKGRRSQRLKQKFKQLLSVYMWRIFLTFDTKNIAV